MVAPSWTRWLVLERLAPWGKPNSSGRHIHMHMLANSGNAGNDGAGRRLAKTGGGGGTGDGEDWDKASGYWQNVAIAMVLAKISVLDVYISYTYIYTEILIYCTDYNTLCTNSYDFCMQ